MNKYFRKSVVFFMIFMFISMINTNATLAKTKNKNIIELRAGVWEIKYTNPNWQTHKENNVYYKITIPHFGYIHFQTKSKGMDGVYREYDDPIGGVLFDENMNVINGRIFDEVALEKGTYYYVVAMNDYLVETSYLRYTYKKLESTYNYCPKKAILMEKNKDYIIATTPKRTYNRWYKVFHKEKGRMYMDLHDPYYCSGVNVYDSKLKLVTFFQTYKTQNTQNANMWTKDELDPGIYYIMVPFFYPPVEIEYMLHMTLK